MQKNTSRVLSKRAESEYMGDGSEANPYRRIFGIETEYGISLTGVQEPYSPGQVAMAMFRPLVERLRSTNVYLSNGARLYVDVGSHPEYATAEARTPMDSLLQDLAGERIIGQMAQEAGRFLAGSLGSDLRVHVFKNNVDARGHSFGCHENYLLRRIVPLTMIRSQLVPFLVTRQLFAGAGRLTEEGYQLSQRADFLDDAVSSATTRSRPMVNTRDEPHADPDQYRRLHIILGDSNRSQTATWLKMATTHLVLCIIESSCRDKGPSPFEGYSLEDASKAMKIVSRDRTGRAPLDLEGDQGSMAALDLQNHYWKTCRAFIDGLGGQAAEAVLPQANLALDLWRSALDALDIGRWDLMADWVDWAAKLRLIEGERERTSDQLRAMRLDLDYHDIATGHSYPALIRHGLMRTLLGKNQISRAMVEPPDNTRARLRGNFVRRVEKTTLSWSCDWTHISLRDGNRHEINLMDPFEYQPDEAYKALMDELDQS